jgi:hypothetical protein
MLVAQALAKAEGAGRCFARTSRRYASLVMRLMKIAGLAAYRTGKLLSPGTRRSGRSARSLRQALPLQRQLLRCRFQIR